MSTPAQRRTKRRKIKPGFPWNGSFETIEQARNYVSSNRIQCLLCGNFYRSLPWHINSIHELGETDYKQRFGIPYGLGIVGTETREKHAAHARANLKPWYDNPEHLDRLHSNHENDELRPLVTTIRAQREQRIRTIGQLPSVVRPCAKCGNDVTTHGARTLCANELILCNLCVTRPLKNGRTPMDEPERQRMRQWMQDNAERAREYQLAKNYWGWQKNPFPLLRYAAKWNARLRIMPQLLKAAADI